MIFNSYFSKFLFTVIILKEDIFLINMQERIHMKACYSNHTNYSFLHYLCLNKGLLIDRLHEIPFLTRLYRLTGLYKPYFIAVLSVNTLQMFSASLSSFFVSWLHSLDFYLPV